MTLIILGAAAIIAMPLWVMVDLLKEKRDEQR